MDCSKFKEHLHEYFTNPDLDPLLSNEIEQHYFECDSCQNDFAIAKMFSDKGFQKDTKEGPKRILMLTKAAKALVDIAMPYGYASETEKENYLAMQDVVYRWLLTFPEEYVEFRKQFKDTVYEIVEEKAAHDKVPEQFYVHSIDPESFRNRPLSQHIDFTIKPMIRSYMKHNNIGLLMDALGFKPK